MNARSQTFEFAVEGRQIDEVVSCMFHSILFHRCVGKYHTNGEDSYSVGTLGYTDVDCDYIDFTYLQVTSQELQRTVAEKINQFHDKLRSSESNRSGQITLEFYQKKKSRWMFKPEEIPWEIWTIKIEQMQLSSENERQFMREKLSDSLTERIFQITEIINKPDYVPKPPHLSELDLVFDTSYTDIQPYLFKRARIPFWEFLKTAFQARSNPEASNHRKRIGGFQPMKVELLPNRTYYWCSCGYAHHQALCDQACKQLRGNLRPLKFTSSKFQVAELCMCKSTERAPYCDQSCRTRFVGMQMRMGNSVEGTYSNVKEFLNTIPKGIDNYRQFAADRQAKLEHTERLRKKVDDEKNKKFSEET
ncbi:unnamed protein product [Rotaria socialis]|uniref:Autophagy-related protein 101 n=1 Tax=Rotaria socialis TaxID=392032 RepID=A0A821E7V1_9BILA|nr:unnamed protein product [Rotaria socialis]CAF4408350.1 unnamed protein product [Rotaria socialis]CAF4417355.1 unnamed protein product [Rotaria socialis]CAF4631258.1 unnamed protein product [Rotaria socialis]